MNKRALAVAAAVALLCTGGTAQADVFNLGTGLTNLETVVVGDPGNNPDTRYDTPGYGSVGYTYRIGKYEVTAAQYTEFLNHKAKSDPYGLYTTNMDTAVDSYGCNIKRTGASGSYTYSVADDWANRPVNYVSFWDACRFANWLHNGQGDGDMEGGAYNLNGYNGDDGKTIGRSPEAKWVLTNEDEWYKAAYYKGGGANAGYWSYPTQSDAISTIMANCALSIGHTTSAGFYPYPSVYGTFDQGGNVCELNESLWLAGQALRIVRGGGFGWPADGLRPLRAVNADGPTGESQDLGFRVASIPEPSSLLVLLCGLGGVVWRGVRARGSAR